MTTVVPSRDDRGQALEDLLYQDRRQAEADLVASKSRGLDISARPMATICCWPPESDMLRCCAPLAEDREKLVDAFERPRTRPAELAADHQVLLDRKRREEAAALRHHGDAAGDQLGGRMPPIASSSKRIIAGAVLMRPTIDFNNVLLPAPLAPITATTSPASTVSEMPKSAWKSP